MHGNNECRVKGKGDRESEPDTSCRSCTAANSQTSDTEVVLTCVSGKGCNPRDLKTKRCKQLLNLLASLLSHS